MSKVTIFGPHDSCMLSFLRRSHQAFLEGSHFLSTPYRFPLLSAKPAWAHISTSSAFSVPTGSQAQADLELLIFLHCRHCTCFPLCWGPNSEVGVPARPAVPLTTWLGSPSACSVPWLCIMPMFRVAKLKLHCLSNLSKYQCRETGDNSQMSQTGQFQVTMKFPLLNSLFKPEVPEGRDANQSAAFLLVYPHPSVSPY